MDGDPGLERKRRGFGSIGGAGLREDVSKMMRYGVEADERLVGDLTIRATERA